MTLPAVREHTDAVIVALDAAGLEVGDAVAPDAEPPYVVVYSIPAGGWTGTLARPNDDAPLVFQVTCVGHSRKQAEWLQDKAITTMLGGGLTVSGRSIAFVDLDLSGGIGRDDTVIPPLFTAMPRFRVFTTTS